MPDSYEISTDPDRLDVTMIHDFLRASYWAPDIPREVVERSLANALCFGAYREGRQIGLARVITDYATFAYLADVFVLPEHRGQGVAQALVRAALAEPRLQGLRRWLLATLDAHDLYARFGFEPLVRPEAFMTIHDPEVYRRAVAAGRH